MTDCIFCKIAKGEIPCNRIYEDKDALAFLDIRPASPKGGHTLVVPKKHYELVTDIPDGLLKKMIIIAKKVAKALMKDFDGVNIVQNNKKVAGQYVPHAHFHVIPRLENDGITIEKWKCNEYAEGEAKKIAEKIKKLLK